MSNEIVGISASIPSEPGDNYSGLGRVENPAWSRHEGKFVIDESPLAGLYDLPGAIKQLEETEPAVRKYVMQEYAKWKMERDCWQPLNELAAFLRVSIAKNQFYVDLWRY
jgi:hypothetical protein